MFLRMDKVFVCESCHDKGVILTSFERYPLCSGEEVAVILNEGDTDIRIK